MSETEARTWLEVMAPHIQRFEVAANFGGSAVYNSVGSAAMAELIKAMATIIDEEIQRQTNRARRQLKKRGKTNGGKLVRGEGKAGNAAQGSTKDRPDQRSQWGVHH